MVKKTRKAIPDCPECNIPIGDCDCNFRCPMCKEVGEYTVDNSIICPSDDCRVGSFYTQ